MYFTRTPQQHIIDAPRRRWTCTPMRSTPSRDRSSEIVPDGQGKVDALDVFDLTCCTRLMQRSPSCQCRPAFILHVCSGTQVHSISRATVQCDGHSAIEDFSACARALYSVAASAASFCTSSIIIFQVHRTTTTRAPIARWTIKSRRVGVGFYE